MNVQELLGARLLRHDNGGVLEPLFSNSGKALESRFGPNSAGDLQLTFPSGRHELDQFKWVVTPGRVPFSQNLNDWNALPAQTILDKVMAAGWVYAKGSGLIGGAQHDVYLTGRARKSQTDTSTFLIIAIGTGGAAHAHKHNGDVHDGPP